MDRHIVIAGQGRAGTTLFYNMLRQTLKNFTLPPTEAAARGFLKIPGNFCTKRPFDIFDIPKILAASAGKKRVDLIITLRDPRDILTSVHSKLPGDYFYAADHCYRFSDDREPEFKAPGILPIHKAISVVASSGVFSQGVFLLKYEDLIADPDRIKAKLARDLDLEFDGSFLDFHKQDISEDMTRAMNGIRPVETTQIKKWRQAKHRARIIDQFTRFPELHDILIALGYEKDRDWFNEFSAEHPEAHSNYPNINRPSLSPKYSYTSRRQASTLPKIKTPPARHLSLPFPLDDTAPPK